jgi:hypothetical protein
MSCQQNPKYPDAELAAWTNEWLGNPEAQKKTMLLFFIEKACDWQREQDALICEQMPYASLRVECAIAIRSGESHAD